MNHLPSWLDSKTAINALGLASYIFDSFVEVAEVIAEEERSGRSELSKLVEKFSELCWEIARKLGERRGHPGFVENRDIYGAALYMLGALAFRETIMATSTDRGVSPTEMLKIMKNDNDVKEAVKVRLAGALYALAVALEAFSKGVTEDINFAPRVGGAGNEPARVM